MSEDAYGEFVKWLRRVNRPSPPPEDIAAYNFGIIESEGGYTLYLVGSREYDPDDDDWACNEDYVPVEKYFELPRGFADGKDWQSIHREVVLLVKRFMESPESVKSFLASASAVTVGFDGGDLERVASAA